MPSRRFPPHWDIEEHNRSCFIVRDNNGQALAYVYSRAKPEGARPLICSRAMRRRIAANVAKLPELLTRPQY